MLGLNCTVAEMDALEAKFCNDTGFNYIAFLEELQPQEPLEFKYLQRCQELRVANHKKTLPETNIATDLEGVMTKIKTKVFNPGG